jgi:hypothetical protein
MAVRLVTSYQLRIPFNVAKATRKLLTHIPPEHLLGLDAIVFTDEVKLKGGQSAAAVYRRSLGREPARIEISVSAIYRDLPRIFFAVPFVPKFMLANVLYHEIGHHHEFRTRGVSNQKQERFAEHYKKQMVRKTFAFWRILLLPISPLVHWLNRRATKSQ